MNAPIRDLAQVRGARAVALIEPSLLSLWSAVDQARVWAFSDGAARPWSVHQELAFYGTAPDERSFAWLLRQGVEHPALFSDADGGGWPLVTARVELVGRTFLWRPEDGARVLLFLGRDRDGLDDDIVAWFPREDRVVSLHGAALLGAEALDDADGPVDVHAGVLEWLRAGRRGTVMVNQSRAVPLLREDKSLVVDGLDFGVKLERALTLKPPKILVREAA